MTRHIHGCDVLGGAVHADAILGGGFDLGSLFGGVASMFGMGGLINGGKKTTTDKKAPAETAAVDAEVKKVLAADEAKRQAALTENIAYAALGITTLGVLGSAVYLIARK